MSKQIDLIYRADGRKIAADGGAIRKARKAICDNIEYGVAGISARITGLDNIGREFCEAVPDDCIIEVIGGDPAIYQAEVIGW